MTVETAVFFVCALICIAGAFGVIWSRNPVHSALSLVATLFGIAVLFLNQNAQLLAAVQVIVYTGAIVVLIMFVIMLLGVDREELRVLVEEQHGDGEQRGDEAQRRVHRVARPDHAPRAEQRDQRTEEEHPELHR